MKKIEGKAQIGTQETTFETTFFDVTSKVESIPQRYNKVFLCDQPGIAGLEVTEADYLARFGPGLLKSRFYVSKIKFRSLQLHSYARR